MKQKLIEGITGTDTFETWFDKTNEMIDFTNTKANVVKVEIDYSGTIHGVPITTRCSNINQPGSTLTVGEPLFNVTTAVNDFSGSYDNDVWDFGHAHMLGRVNGGPTFLSAWTAQADGWGSISGSSNPSSQKALYGIISKIISNDAVNKKILLEVCRPGGSFDIKFSDLKSPSWKNPGQKFYFDNIKLGGQYFLGLIQPYPYVEYPCQSEFPNKYAGNGSTGAFFQNVGYAEPNVYFATDLGLDTTQVTDLQYLVITPYNDADETLNVYLHPNAPNQKYVNVFSMATGLTYGSAAITRIINPNPSKQFEGAPSTRTYPFTYTNTDPVGGTQDCRWRQITPFNFNYSSKLTIITVNTEDNSDSNANNTLIFIQNYGTADSVTFIYQGANWVKVNNNSGLGSFVSQNNKLNITFNNVGKYYVCNRLLQGATPLIAINEIG